MTSAVNHVAALTRATARAMGVVTKWKDTFLSVVVVTALPA